MQLFDSSIRKPSPHVLIGDKSSEGGCVVGTGAAPTSFVAIISTSAFDDGISTNEREQKNKIKSIHRIMR